MSHLSLSTLCTYALPLREYDRLALDAQPDDRPERARSARPARRGPTRRRGLLGRVRLPRLVAGTR